MISQIQKVINIISQVDYSLDIEFSIIDVKGNQLFGNVKAYDAVYDLFAGFVEFSEYNDVVYIDYIEVDEDYKRQGVATKMIERIKEEFPGEEIKFGMVTDEGSKFVDSL